MLLCFSVCFVFLFLGKEKKETYLFVKLLGNFGVFKNGVQKCMKPFPVLPSILSVFLLLETEKGGEKEIYVFTTFV